MNIVDTIRKTLNVLTSDSTFIIERIDYDEKNFGNVCAVLSSTKQIKIRFIKDRGEFWCEVAYDGEWYYIEDVFTLIGVAFTNRSKDLVDFIAEMTALIKKSMPQISQAFNEKNLKDTQGKIKDIATKRVMGMFKL